MLGLLSEATLQDAGSKRPEPTLLTKEGFSGFLAETGMETGAIRRRGMREGLDSARVLWITQAVVLGKPKGKRETSVNLKAHGAEGNLVESRELGRPFVCVI